MPKSPQDLPGKGKNHPRWWFDHQDGRVSEGNGNNWDYLGVTVHPKKQNKRIKKLTARRAGFEQTMADKTVPPSLARGYRKPGSMNPRAH